MLGPETAIAAGVGDRLREAGLTVFGPNRSGGRLESSKIFAKRFMERHGIPTARAVVAHSLDAAQQGAGRLETARSSSKPTAWPPAKASSSRRTSKRPARCSREWYDGARIPGGGSDVLLEERLEGREVSVFALCDGRAIVPFAAACDYKRAGDGDTGPNTGGMGAYSPPARISRRSRRSRSRAHPGAAACADLLAEGEELHRRALLRSDVERRGAAASSSSTRASAIPRRKC